MLDATTVILYDFRTMKKERTPLKVLEKAWLTAGTKSAFADKLGISRQAFSQWISDRKVPATRVLSVEKATGGLVSRHELRPDVFGRK